MPDTSLDPKFLPPTKSTVEVSDGAKLEAGRNISIGGDGAGQVKSITFISYSRKDEAFVLQLQAALTGPDRHVWVDKKDIAAGAEWETDISDGIVAADTFVFIISPDSATSEPCKKEIDYAVEHNKRILPILYCDVPDAQVHPSLRSLNYFYFRESDDFDAKIKELIQTLGTADYKWVRAHKRLLTRAIEWDRKKHDGSLLLRGKDLDEAEEWQAQAATGKEPKPTPLQSQYILASRKSETLRRRRILIAGMVALGAMFVLTVIAFIQRDEAQRQARIALSRQLAAQAQSQLSDQFDLALLLGVQSYLVTPTVEARSILLTGLLRSPRLKSLLHGHTDGIWSVAYSRDGKLLASGGRDGLIILWDTSNPGSAVQLGELPRAHLEVWTLAFSPEGNILASGGNDGSIILWDVSDPRAPVQVGPPLASGYHNWVESVAFSPDGNLLASSGSPGAIILWDVSNPRAPVQLGPPLTVNRESIESAASIESVAFSPDGKILASGSDDKTVTLWDVSKPKAPVQLHKPLTGHTDFVLSVVFSPNGQTLATSSRDATIILWNVSDPKAPFRQGKPLAGHTSWVEQIAFSPDGQTLASGSDDQSIRLWDVSDPQSPLQLGAPLVGHTNSIWGIAFSPDGKTLASGSRDKTIILWDVMDPKSPAGLASPRFDGLAHVDSMAFSPVSKTLALVNGGKVVLWNMADLPLLKEMTWLPIGQTDMLESVAFDPNGKTLALASCGKRNQKRECAQGEITLWDVSNPHRPYQLGNPLAGHTNGINSVAFSSDGTVLASGGEDGVVFLWDVSNPHRPYQLGTSLSDKSITKVRSVAFSRNGNILASGGDDARIHLWDVSNPRTPVHLGAQNTDHTFGVWSVAFNADGRTVASSGTGPVVDLWNVSNPHDPVKWGTPLIGHTLNVLSVVFSSDGKTLATVSEDHTVILWDVSNPQGPRRLGTLLTSINANNTILSAAFSPDGKTLASGGCRLDGFKCTRGEVILWDIDPISWQARACRIAGRNLTRIEFAQYINPDPAAYDNDYAKNPTCPDLPVEPAATPTPVPTLIQ